METIQIVKFSKREFSPGTWNRTRDDIQGSHLVVCDNSRQMKGLALCT
jgi:hypothetical protein